MSIEGQGHFLTLFSRFCLFCAYMRPRYQVSVYRAIGPLVFHKTENYLFETKISKVELSVSLCLVYIYININSSPDLSKSLQLFFFTFFGQYITYINYYHIVSLWQSIDTMIQ